MITTKSQLLKSKSEPTRTLQSAYNLTQGDYKFEQVIFADQYIQYIAFQQIGLHSCKKSDRSSL